MLIEHFIWSKYTRPVPHSDVIFVQLNGHYNLTFAENFATSWQISGCNPVVGEESWSRNIYSPIINSWCMFWQLKCGSNKNGNSHTIALIYRFYLRGQQYRQDILELFLYVFSFIFIFYWLKNHRQLLIFHEHLLKSIFYYILSAIMNLISIFIIICNKPYQLANSITIVIFVTSNFFLFIQ